jgi:ribosomal RNA-processing protein 17
MGGFKGKAVIHKKKRQGKPLVFDDTNRREWLTGFRKRKLGRQKEGAENERLMAVAKKRFERLQRKRAESSILRDLAREEESFHAQQAAALEPEDEGDDEGDSSEEEQQLGVAKKEVKYETKTQVVTVITQPLDNVPLEESEDEAPEEVVSAEANQEWTQPHENKNNSRLDEPRIKKLMKDLEAKSHSKYGIEGKKQRKIKKKRKFKASDKKSKAGPKDKKSKGGKGGKRAK